MGAMSTYKQEPELTWPDICERVSAILQLPTEHSDPWRQDRINPGEDSAAILIAMIAICHMHTGMMPQRITTSYEPSFVAYYLREGKRGGIEAYPPTDSESGPPGVLFWSGLDDFAEPLPLAGALQGDRFKAMAAFLGATPP
jgi:hypothetical protein